MSEAALLLTGLCLPVQRGISEVPKGELLLPLAIVEQGGKHHLVR